MTHACESDGFHVELNVSSGSWNGKHRPQSFVPRLAASFLVHEVTVKHSFPHKSGCYLAAA